MSFLRTLTKERMGEKKKKLTSKANFGATTNMEAMHTPGGPGFLPKLCVGFSALG